MSISERPALRSPVTRFLAAAAASVMASLVAAAGREEAERTLQTVVVTAERIGTGPQAEAAATPGAVSVVDGRALQQRGVTHLADALRYVPGIFAESYNGTDETFYSSRGSNLDATDYDRNGIRLFQDGLAVTAADGNNHNRAPDPLNAHSVTIAHGANALAYGASTLGGAMDFATPTAHDTRPGVSVSGGSFGQWGARATLTGAQDSFDALVTLATQQRDGYRDHSRQDRREVNANLGWQAAPGLSARMYGTWSDYSAQLPREVSRATLLSAPRTARADAIAGNHHKHVQAWRVAFKTVASDLAGGVLEAGVSHERQALFHPIVSTPFFSLLIDTDQQNTGTMLRFRREAGTHGLALGINHAWSKVAGGNYQNLSGQRGSLLYETDDRSTSLEIYAMDRWRFAPHWTLVYGAQLVRATRDAGSFAADFSAVNPRLGLIRDYGKASQWFASASRVYEAPTNYELVDEMGGGTEPLDAMHGISVETGLRGEARPGTSRLHWHATAYYTALRDEILSVDDPAAPGTSLAANMPQTTHAGIEALLGASLAIGDRYRMEPVLSATFNAFSFDDHARYGSNRLASAPRWFARGEVMIAQAAGFSAGPTFDFVGPRFADFANTYRVGSHALLGARASYAGNNWLFYIEGRNLLDRRYAATVLARNAASPESQVLFPGAPRSVSLGARLEW